MGHPFTYRKRSFMNTETLHDLIECGIINLAYIQKQAENMERQKMLDKNPWKMYQGKDGSWYVYLPNGNTRKRIKRKNKKDIEQAIVSYWREKEENPTIEETFTEWNDRRLKLQQIAPGTHQRNKQIFNRCYTEFGKRKIKSVTPEEISDFLEEQIAKCGLTAKAFSGLKSITKGFLKRAKKRRLISFRVEELFYDLEDLSFKKNRKKDEEEVFMDNEVSDILSYLIENPDIRNLGILLMFLTGLRVGELVALKFEDIENNIIHVRRTETRFCVDKKYVYEVKESPKTEAGDRMAVVPVEYAWILKRLKMQSPFGEYIFSEKGKRFTTNVIRRRLTRVCNTLNIPARSPHKIRKTYATIMFENHVDSKMLIKMMGHTDISCTENHYHRNRKDTEQMTQIINSIPDFQLQAK